MKKWSIPVLVLAVALGILTGWYVFSRPDSDARAMAAAPTTICFDKDTLLLGTLKYSSRHEAVFRFTNTGTAPLLIRNVVPSCDCTAVKWEKRPVEPGESGEIRIGYSPNSLGMFIKNIEVHCNVPGHKVNLKIRGNVIE